MDGRYGDLPLLGQSHLSRRRLVGAGGRRLSLRLTLDKVHVLATPGLDAHAVYVALSRHRTRVDLHYGGDDFADQDRLVRTLSRARGKDMASDYPPQTASPQITATTMRNPSRDLSEVSNAQPTLADAVTRHGKIVRAMKFAQRIGDPYTSGQRTEILASRSALDSMLPHAARDLESAFAANPSLIAEAAVGRAQATIRAMQLEAEMRGNPTLRADVFVQRWQTLDRQRRLLLRDHETTRAGTVADPTHSSRAVQRRAGRADSSPP